MKYLKLFNDPYLPKDGKILESVKQKQKTTESDIPKFIEKISELIEINWEIYEFDEKMVEGVIKKSLKKIPYIELYSPEEAYTKTELLAIYILNVGGSVAGDLSDSNSKNNFRYDDLLKNIEKILKFDRFGDKKLSYNGPDITSSSVLATTPNIKTQIKEIKDTISRYYMEYNEETDEEVEDRLAELKIIFGCVYQFGYGLKYDMVRSAKDEERTKMMDLMGKKERTVEEEKEFKDALKKFMSKL